MGDPDPYPQVFQIQNGIPGSVRVSATVSETEIYTNKREKGLTQRRVGERQGLFRNIIERGEICEWKVLV